MDAPAPNEPLGESGRDVSIRTLPINILHDQKDIWLFPVKLAEGHHLLPTIGVVGLTAGLIAADPHDQGYFRRTTSFNSFNHVFDSAGSAGFIALVPLSMYAVGALSHDSYATKTSLLAGEAFADAAIVSLAIKAITRRTSPSSIAPSGPFSDTFFQSKQNAFHTGGFPSIHAVAAMSVATVISRRYGSHRWVPFVAYGLAGAISFSRVSRSNHFSSDVFLGAALGYTIARFDVLRGQ
jgi:hypothetical protein